MGLGVSRDGKMIGNNVAIIGRPGISEPKAYALGGKDVSAIKELSVESFVVEDATVNYVDGRTVMDFKVSFGDWGVSLDDDDVDDDGPPRIWLDGPTTFIWAHGKDGEADMGYHGPDQRSAHVIEDLMIPQGVATTTTTMMSEGGSMGSSFAWIAHGVAAFVAWGIFAPTAITTAVVRDLATPLLIRHKGWFESYWLRVHVGLNALACATTIAVFSVAVHNVNREGYDHFDNGHAKMGLAMLVLCLHQALGGLMRPSREVSSPDDDDEDEDGGVDVDEGGIDNEEVVDGRQRTMPMKSVTRQAWELLHKCLGVTLFFFGMWQMHEGMALYHERYDNSGYVVAVGFYVAWMSMWTVVIVGGIAYKWHLSRNGGAVVEGDEKIKSETEMSNVSDAGDEHMDEHIDQHVFL